MRRGADGTGHSRVPTTKHTSESSGWFAGALGSAAHTIDRGVHDAVNYIDNYQPLRKDLPKKKKK